MKDKSCNNPEKKNFIKKRLYYKETPTWVFYCEYSKNFRNNFFYRATTVAAFELCSKYQKEFLTKEVSGEIACHLISLFYVQMQEPTRSSITTRAFVFPAKFYCHKIFETGSR